MNKMEFPNIFADFDNSNFDCDARIFDLSAVENNDTYYDKSYELSVLTAIPCAIILEEAVMKLKLLGKLMNSSNVDDESDFQTEQEMIATQYSSDLETTPDDGYTKVQRNRRYLEKVFKSTSENLVEGRNFFKLVNFIQSHESNFEKKNATLQSHANNKIEIDRLRQVLKNEYEHFTEKYQLLSEEIGCLKDQLEDLRKEQQVTYDIIKLWEDSRVEQNNMKLEYQEKRFNDIVVNIETDIEKETRVNAEIQSYIFEDQEISSQQIQYWVERYDSDMDAMKAKIAELSSKRSMHLSDMTDLQKLYDEHNAEINEYLKLKEKRKREAEEKTLKTASAFKIQRWWRNIMVEKCLGPFQKKKEKRSVSGKKKK